MIVADASVVAKWLFTEEEHARAIGELIRSITVTGDPLYAPSHFRGEVLNVIRKRVRRNSLNQEQASALLDQFLLLPIDVVSPPEEHHDALEIATKFDLPTIYDAYNLNVAHVVGCDLWTDDRRPLRTLAGRLPYVRWIGGVLWVNLALVAFKRRTSGRTPLGPS